MNAGLAGIHSSSKMQKGPNSPFFAVAGAKFTYDTSNLQIRFMEDTYPWLFYDIIVQGHAYIAICL